MEVGKLDTNGTMPLFYFILDAASPDNPSASRVKHYFVSTRLDSYVEAFLFLTKILCSPQTDPTYRKWHNLYVKVFGGITFDNFMKNIQTLNSSYFNLDTTEEAARSRVEDLNNAYSTNVSGVGVSHIGAGLNRTGTRSTATMMNATAGSRYNQTSFQMVPATSRPNGEDADAAVELHRLRTELSEVSARLRLAKQQQTLGNLADAERAALQYKLEQAYQDVEMERSKVKALEERHGGQIRTMQERIDRLMEMHENAVRDLSDADRQRLVDIEGAFAKREADMQRQFDEQLTEKSKKLDRANARIEAMETQLGKLSDELLEVRGERQKMVLELQTANNEYAAHEDLIRKQKAMIETLENQLGEQRKSIRRLTDEQGKDDAEFHRLRTDLGRWRQEAERYAKFTGILQGELERLDSTSAIAADMMRQQSFMSPPNHNVTETNVDTRYTTSFRR